MIEVIEAKQPKLKAYDLSRWKPYLWAVLLSVIAKLPTISNNIIFIDEPTYLIHARQVDTFQTFLYSFSYRTEPKFQLGLLPYLLALWVNSANAILIVRLLGLVAVAISAILIIQLSKIMFAQVWAGFFSLVIWLIYLNRLPDSAAPVLEYYQTPLLLFSFWLFLKKYEHKNYLFWSGFSIGLATLIKPPALVVAPLLAVSLLCLDSKKYKENRLAFLKLRTIPVVYFGAGVILPILLFVLPYLIKPETLADLKFNLVDLSSSYGAIGNHSLLVRALELLGLFKLDYLVLLAVTTVAYFVSLIRRNPKTWTRTDSYQFLIQGIGWALFAGYAFGQVKAHYLVPVLPFLMLFVGYRINLFQRWLSRPGRRKAFIVVLGGWLVFSEILTLLLYIWLFIDKEQLYKAQMGPIDEPALINYIQTNSAPQDSIWVYYNTPEIYWRANRRPATNDSVGSWLIYIYNPFWFEKTQRELARDAPALLIGIDDPRFKLNEPARLTEIPVVKDWIAQNYSCDDKIVAGTTICKRRTG